MNIQKIKGISINELERAYDKVHAWFFAFPEREFSLNELSEELEIGKTTANIVVLQLAKDGFLKLSRLGKLWRISANQAHRWFETRKVPFNLRNVYESGIIDWIDANITNAKVIILFGSYRKGDDVEVSDLDIAVEVTGNRKFEIFKVMIQRLGYRENVKANIHVFSRNNIDINLFASIANGIVLTGFLEVKP